MLRELQGILAPRMPVDRIVLVLQQVGAGFGSQAIGHVLSRCGETSRTEQAAGEMPWLLIGVFRRRKGAVANFVTELAGRLRQLFPYLGILLDEARDAAGRQSRHVMQD